MALFKDAAGQLVIAASMPAGGAVVTAAASSNLSDLAAWYRNLDAANLDWHPAKFYNGGAESAALGTNGYSNAQVAAYKRSATLPTDNPGAVTYDFTNASITTSLGSGWYSDIPAGSGPVYVVFAPAASQDTTFAILAADWTNPPVLLFDSGTDGESSFPSFVFIRSATQPATPTGGSYASPLPITVGWSDGIPSDNNQPLWMSKRVFSKYGGAPQDAAWSAPSKVGTPSTSSKLQFSVDGTTGWHDYPSAGDEFMRSGTSTNNGATWAYAGVVRIKGEAGSSGTATRGPSHWYTSGSSWSDSVANTVVTAAGYTPMAGDQVTISGANFAHVKKYTGSSWIDLGQVITDDLVVEKSLTVNSVNTNMFDIRDEFGNIIFSAGHPVDYSRVGGLTRPDNNATVGADYSNLKAGTGGNLIPNSDFKSGIDNWHINWVQAGGSNYLMALDIGGASYTPAGGHAISCVRNIADASINGVIDLFIDKKIPVVPGQRFETFAYIASHRCNAGMWIGFYKDVAGVETWVNEVFFPRNWTTSTDSNGGPNLSNWNKTGGFLTVPPTTQYLHIGIRGTAIAAGQTVDPYFWATNLFLAEAHAGQTELSTWAPSGAGGRFSELNQITAENSDVFMGIASIKGAHIGYAEIDTLRVDGGAVTSVDTDILQGSLSIPNPADADGLYGSKVVILQKQLPIVDLATVRIIDINFILYHGCPNPGRLWVSIEKNGTEYASVSFNPLTRFVMGASIQPYSFTFEIPVGANEDVMARVKLQTMNGLGATEHWSGTPPAVLSGARLVCHTAKR